MPFYPGGSSGGGTVSSIVAGNGLSGGTITNSGTLAIDASGFPISDGALLIGSGTSFALNPLTAGNGINIIVSPGHVSIASLTPSGSQLWLYQANTSITSGTAPSGDVYWNNATQTSATVIALSHITDDGTDVDLWIDQIATGDTLIIQDQNDSTNYQTWQCSGAVVVHPNSYVEVPVTLVTSAGTGTTGFANNHRLFVALFVAATPQEWTAGTVTAVGTGLAVNSGTITGDWQAGTVSAVGTGLTLATGTLAATASGGSTLTPAVKTTGYSVQASDVGKLLIANGTTISFAVPAPGTIGANNRLSFNNITDSPGTITVASGTIDTGGTILYMGREQGLDLTNDGTNWFSQPRMGAALVGRGGGLSIGNTNTIGITGVGIAIGTSNNANTDSVAIGKSNTVNGSSQPAFAIGNSNSATANGAIAIGVSNILSSQTCWAVGASNTITSGNPFVAGYSNQVSGSKHIVEGESIVATGALHNFLTGYRINDFGVGRVWGIGWGGPDGSNTAPMMENHSQLYIATTGTVAVRLTTDGGAASSTNISNPGTKSYGHFYCDFVVTDIATGDANTYYMATPGIISKGTTAASTTVNGVTITAGATIGAGLTLAATPTIAADTTNGGFSIGFTPPAGNTHSVRGQAYLRSFIGRLT